MNSAPPDRPFDPLVVRRAEELSARYPIHVSPDEAGGYVGRVTELPAVFGCGDTDTDALRATREHIKWALAYMIEQGRTIPAPLSLAIH